MAAILVHTKGFNNIVVHEDADSVNDDVLRSWIVGHRRGSRRAQDENGRMVLDGCCLYCQNSQAFNSKFSIAHVY